MEHNIGRLCAIWNHATNPAVPLTDNGHNARRKLARKVMRLITRHTRCYQTREFSSGALYVKGHY